MPCTKCKSDFNIFNWKFKCGECCDRYCAKCLNRQEGILYCDKCTILITRPPDRAKLMELKAKDLQDYLNKNNISTYGLVEKHELVELFCSRPIPVCRKRGTDRLTANFGGSVPDLTNRPQAMINNLRANLESVINSQIPRSTGVFSTSTSPTREAPRPPRPPPPRFYRPAEPTPPPASQQQPENNVPENNSPKLDIPKYPKLSDFGSAEDLTSLSSKQLKELLALNRVDYRGCVEKSELLERATRLWNDNDKQRQHELPDNVEDLCKLCMDAPLDCVLLECGHIATCIACGKQLAECPICRQYVTRVVRTFKA